MSQQLLTLIAPKALDDTLTDWLLERDDITGFTSFETAGHGSSTTVMSALEKVRGRLSKIQIQIVLKESLTAVLMTDLSEEFSNASIHYFLTSVTQTGRL